MPRTISKEDINIHERALASLRHFHQYGDNTFMTKLVLELPKSNRRAALVTWFVEYSPALWIIHAQKFRGKRLDELFDFEGAERKPFWEHKVWRTPRRHVSGVAFDAEVFLQRVAEELDVNQDCISVRQLELLRSVLDDILEQKSSNRAVNPDAPKAARRLP